MKEESLKFLIWVFGKIFSARFIALVALIATFCMMTLQCVESYTTFMMSNKDLPAGAKEIMLIIIGAFISTINTVIAFYFLRNDRQTADNKQP